MQKLYEWRVRGQYIVESMVRTEFLIRVLNSMTTGSRYWKHQTEKPAMKLIKLQICGGGGGGGDDDDDSPAWSKVC